MSGTGLAAAGCFSDRQATSPSDTPCLLPSTGGVPGSTVVLIRGFSFDPAVVRMPAGGRVTWVNCETSATAHTTTADAGAWSSPLLAPGDGFTRTFDASGAFAYHCMPHPFMRGTVTVE